MKQFPLFLIPFKLLRDVISPLDKKWHHIFFLFLFKHPPF